jgi:hypothetical protein
MILIHSIGATVGIRPGGSPERVSDISLRISSTRQAVIRGPSFIGLGKRLDLSPAHQGFFSGS